MITWACVRLARWRNEPLTRATGCRLARPRASCGGSSPGSVCRLSSSTGPTGPPGPGRQDAREKGGEAEFKHKAAAAGGKRSGTGAAAARVRPPSFRIPACCKSFQSDPHLSTYQGCRRDVQPWLGAAGSHGSCQGGRCSPSCCCRMAGQSRRLCRSQCHDPLSAVLSWLASLWPVKQAGRSFGVRDTV